jgi:hypothetical protein
MGLIDPNSQWNTENRDNNEQRSDCDSQSRPSHCLTLLARIVSSIPYSGEPTTITRVPAIGL